MATGKANSDRLETAPARATQIGNEQSPMERVARSLRANSGLLFILPGLIIYLGFITWPIIATFYNSFFIWDGFSPDREFTGLDHYVRLLTKDRAFRLSIRNNIYWAVITVVVLSILGFLFAYLLNQRIRLRNTYRAALFLPVTASLVVIGFTWEFIYQPEVGMLTYALRRYGFDHLVRIWLADPDVTIFAIIVVSLWASLGFWVVVFLAALQAVPPDLYDCAAVDGATGFRKMWHIAVPLTMGTTRALWILGLIRAINAFGLVFLLSRGGPYHASEVIAYQIYQQAFRTNHTGYASALSVVLLLISAVVTIIQLLLLRGRRIQL